MPVVALLGGPNVGKSTLFNRLTKTRDALVADYPGLTRDRQYGHAEMDGRPFIIIDTGGLIDEADDIDDLVMQQSLQAVHEADLILLLVDAQQGLNAHDEQIAGQLRRHGKPVQLLVNKIDSMDADMALSEFHALGLGEPVAIAAAQGRGLRKLAEKLVEHFPAPAESGSQADSADRGMTFAVVGRPNVGKSTYINRLLGEQRLVIFDQPGTTRDSIFIPLRYNTQKITLVDTAGVRRRGRIKQAVEKFSVAKTLQAIDAANVVIMILDAREGIADQDAGLLGYILERGRALVLAVNKWDRLSTGQRSTIKTQLELKLGFTDFAKLHFISALHGTGVFEVLSSAERAYKASFRRFATPVLNKLLHDLLAEHQPPLARGRRIKLRYIHQGGINPPRFIIHGNSTEAVPDSYRRYLINQIRRRLRLQGTPIEIEFRGGDNPFKDRKNKLTPRQIKKRQRIRQQHRKR